MTSFPIGQNPFFHPAPFVYSVLPENNRIVDLDDADLESLAIETRLSEGGPQCRYCGSQKESYSKHNEWCPWVKQISGLDGLESLSIPRAVVRNVTMDATTAYTTTYDNPFIVTDIGYSIDTSVVTPWRFAGRNE